MPIILEALGIVRYNEGLRRCSREDANSYPTRRDLDTIVGRKDREQMSREKWYFRILPAIICALIFWTPQVCYGLVVSEIMYHPVEEGGSPSGDENLEFIELYNNKATREDIGGYAFTNGIDYTFPAGTMLAGKGYLVVARDPAAVEAAYGITGVYGPYSGRLNNDGERIELSNENGAVVISFRYNDARPWPASADGAGHSIILAKASGDPEEASSWAASTLIGGTPGGPDASGFKIRY